MKSTHSTKFENQGSSQAAERARTDARGRVWVSRQKREQYLDEFEKSGLSAAEFARLAGINYGTFATWRQKRREQKRREATSAGPQSLQLLEACVDCAAPAPAFALTIDLPGNARLRVESPAHLRLAVELLAMLGQTTRLTC